MKSSFAHVGTICSLIFLAAFSRWIPHPPNFTSVAAVGIFAGSLLWERKWMTFLIPLCAMFLSDAVLGFHELIPFTYAALLVTPFLGRFVGKQNMVAPILSTSFVSSLIFFIVSNFGVWWTGSLYTKDLSGLTTCYIAAIPFFGNFLASTIFYSLVMFYGFRVLEKLSLSKTEEVLL